MTSNTLQGSDKTRERGPVAEKNSTAAGLRQAVPETDGVPQVGVHEHAPVQRRDGHLHRHPVRPHQDLAGHQN